jgi:WD40 repeat protein
MLVLKRKLIFTRRKIIIVALSATGVALGAGLLAYLSEGHDAPLLKVLRLPAKGRQVVWSPDGKRLAVVMIYEPLILGKKDRALQLWDLERGDKSALSARSMLRGLWIGEVAFSPDGKSIAATVSEERRSGNMLRIDNVVKLLDPETLALKQMFEPDGRSFPQCLAFSPDGKFFAAGDPSGKMIELRNAQSGLLERTLRTDKAQPWSLAFSLDGNTLAVGGQLGSGHQNGQPTGQVQLWDTGTWTLKQVLKQQQYVNTVSISANGKLLASGGGGDLIQLWDAQTGELVHSLQGLQSGTRCVAISPNSETVAAGGRDGKVRLWDVQTGKLKTTLKGPGWGWWGASEIYSVAFSPDGRTLASASDDQTVCLWTIFQGVAEN